MDSQGNTTTSENRTSFNSNLNMSEFVQVNHKVFFAAAERNKEVILDQLRSSLDKAKMGTGSKRVSMITTIGASVIRR
jgi:hypothetical protein